MLLLSAINLRGKFTFAACSPRAGWLGWPAPSHGHCSYEPANITSLSHKRTSNDTNQPTEQAEKTRRQKGQITPDLVSCKNRLYASEDKGK